MVRFRDIPQDVKRRVPPLAAAAAAVLLFLPVLGFELLEYDDLIYVLEGPLSGGLTLASIADAFLSPYFRSYSPLTLLSHAVDLRLWGENGGMHHLLNLLLHAVNVLLVYRIAVELLGGGSTRLTPGTTVFAAFSAALLFAIHPLQVEPVAWVSGRKDLLAGFFLLASFLTYLRFPGARDETKDGGEDAAEPGGRDHGREPGRSGGAGQVRAGGVGSAQVEGRGSGRKAAWLTLSTVLFILALLSKSTSAAFPLVLVVCDRLLLGRRDSWSTLLREKGVMLLAAGCAILVSVLAGRGHDTSDLLAGFPPAARILLPVFTPAYYLWQLAWPSGLTPFTPAPPLPWVFAGAGLTVVVTASLFRWRQPGLLAAWLAFLILLVPTIGGTFLETGMQPWADRFTYVPMIGVFVAAGAGIALIPSARTRAVSMVVLAAGLAFTTTGQLRHWRDTEAVWTRVVHASPALAKGYKNLGSIRHSQGRSEEAVLLLRQAVALKPAYAEAQNDLGLALTAAGRPEEALGPHRMAIALDSSRAEGYNGYGIALLRTGDPRGAYEVFLRGIDVQPGSAKLRYNAGAAALASGDTLAAIGRFREPVSLEPAAAQAAMNAAVLLEARGDTAAAAWYAKAAEAGSAEARERLAKQGRHQEQGVR